MSVIARIGFSLGGGAVVKDDHVHSEVALSPSALAGRRRGDPYPALPAPAESARQELASPTNGELEA